MEREEKRTMIAEKYVGALKSLLMSLDSAGFTISGWHVKAKVTADFPKAAVELGYIKPLKVVGLKVVYISCAEIEEITIKDGLHIYDKCYDLYRAREERLKDKRAAAKAIGVGGKPISDKDEVVEEVVKQEKLDLLLDRMEQILDPITDLSKASIEELVTELHKRGFTGEAVRIQEHKF